MLMVMVMVKLMVIVMVMVMVMVVVLVIAPTPVSQGPGGIQLQCTYSVTTFQKKVCNNSVPRVYQECNNSVTTA
jgi:hypothetical protein